MSEIRPPEVEALLEHAAFLRRLAARLLGGDDRADDVVQEAFLVALYRPPRRSAPLRRWLAAVARNAALRVLRADRRRARRETDAPVRPPVPSPSETASRLEAQRDVAQAVLALEEPYRRTVLLRFYDDLPAAEIARREGIPAETVRTRTRRALAVLRARLDRRHGDRRTWALALVPLLTVPTAAVASAAGEAVVGGKAKVALVALLVAALGAGLAISSRSPSTTRAWPEERTSALARATWKGPPEAADPLPVAIAPKATPGAVVGLVVDVAGRPVLGAEVAAFDIGLWRERARATSDAAGRFRLAPLDDPVRIRAHARGYARAATQAWPGRSLVIRLGGAGRLEGVVRRAAGGPAIGCRVLVQGPGSEDRAIEAVTDAAGRYSVEDLGAGEWKVEFVPRRAARAPRLGQFRVEIRAGETTSLSCPVVDGLTVTGTVRDASTGEPIAGARFGDRFWRVRTDPDGRYVLRGLPLEPWWLRVTAPGRLTKKVSLVPDPGRDRLEADVLLEPIPPVTGRVVDARGDGVVGARVRTWGASVRTREGGAFSIVVDRLRARLVATAPGHSPGEITIAEPTASPVTVRLLPGTTVEGRVVDPAGSPIVDAEVRLLSEDRMLPPARAWSDATGRFRFAGNRPGDATMVVRAAGFAVTTVTASAVAAGETRMLPDVVLEPESTVAGRVVGPDGAPVPEARVSAFVGREPVDTRTDGAGRFRLGSLAAGDVNVGVSCPLGSTTRWRVPTGTTDLLVRLREPRFGDVTGRVVRADGSAVTCALIRLFADGRYRGGPFVQTPDGSFRVSFPPGSYELEALTRRGEISAPVPIRVVRGETTGPVRLVLRPGPMISGTVRSPDGAPVAGAHVFLESTDPLESGGTVADRDGRFLFGPVHPGRHVIRARSRDWVEVEKEVVVGPGGPGRTDLTLGGESGSLRVRVVDGEGRRLDDYRLELKGSRGERVRVVWFPGKGLLEAARYLWRIESAGDGSPLLVIERLRPGKYVVAVRGGSGRGRVEAIVTAGSHEEVTVTVR